MYNPFSLEGKKVLITGASSGIGRQCAIDCSQMGSSLVILGRNKDNLQETFSHLRGEGHLLIPFDLCDFDSMPSLVASIVDKTGKLDGILHCAGISGILPMKLTKNSDLEKFMQTNVFSAIELTREVLKKKNFSAEGGSIVFLSSVMGIVGEKAKFVYSMTKGALISGCRSLALEYAERKIRFNCISPGVIETPINAKQPYLADPVLREKTENAHPLGIGKTTDISCAAIYLLSDAARWITGQNIIIDGGYTSL